MPEIRIHHATAVTMDGDQLLEDAAIVIADAHIRYVGPLRDSPAPSAEAEVIEAAGLVAMPGLINAHTHLGMTLFRGAADDLPLMPWLEEKIWPVEVHFTGEDIYWASLLGIAEMLRAGVTTFADMYWHIEQGARAVRESGIRAGLSGVVIGVHAGGQQMLQEAINRVKELKAENHPRITPFFGPHAPYTVPTTLLTEIIAAAVELGVGINTHLSETADEVAISEYEFGVPPIKRMQQLGMFAVPVAAAHCVHPRDEEIDILAEHQVGVVHCPCSNMKLGSGIAPIPRLLASGVKVGLGTDSTGSNNTLDVLREVRMAALLHKVHGHPTVLPALQALSLATHGSAQALHMDAQLGSLQAGKLADIILLDFNKPHLTPAHRVISDLVYAAYASDVDTVIVHGNVLMRGRQLLTLDEERIRAKVNEAAHRLFIR